MKKIYILISIVLSVLVLVNVFVMSEEKCENGFELTTKIKSIHYPYVCHNKNIDLSYVKIYSDANIRVFFKSKNECGYNCDINGRDCALLDTSYGYIKGICNIEDCPSGYKRLVYFLGKGMCKEENGKKVLYANGKNSFSDANIIKEKYKKKHKVNIVESSRNWSCFLTSGIFRWCN